MSTLTYPGQGLSLSQLVFALNEELKRVANSPSWVAYDHFWRTVLIVPLTQILLRCDFKIRPRYVYRAGKYPRVAELIRRHKPLPARSSLSYPHLSLGRSRRFSRQHCVPSLAKNLSATCNLVVQLEPVTQADQLLHKNSPRARKRFAAGHHFLSLAPCRYSRAAQPPRSEIQESQLYI
jgi:hypothetical protein